MELKAIERLYNMGNFYRFASFVEGNSHLSDDEVLDYEAYAFSLERTRKPVPMAHSSTRNMEISSDDDDDTDYDDD